MSSEYCSTRLYDIRNGFRGVHTWVKLTLSLIRKKSFNLGGSWPEIDNSVNKNWRHAWKENFDNRISSMNYLREEPGLINTANTCYCANTFYLMELELALFFIWGKVRWQFFFKKFTPLGHQQPALIFPCWQQEIWMGSFFLCVRARVLGGVRWWKEQNCMKEWKDFLIPNH